MFLVLTGFTPLLAQEVTVYGYIRDAATGDPLPYANIQVLESGTGKISDDRGYFSLAIPAGEQCLRASMVGYVPKEVCGAWLSDTLVVFPLTVKTLDEVVIREKPLSLVTQGLLGFQKVPVSQIQQLPAFLGEPDVLRAITLLPGLETGREGLGNLFVRGGDRGQNLILLDGVPLYNVNHAGGFVGAVNSRAIKDVEVYKGGFPARFGGRASSVIDIRTREGNAEKVAANMHLGLTNSGFTVEGPLGSPQTTYHLSGRSAYLDLLLLPVRLVVNSRGEGNYAGLTFYDVNGKLAHRFSDRHRLYLTAYSGSDRYDVFDLTDFGDQQYRENSRYAIHQQLITLGEQVNVTPSLYWEQSLGYSQYISRYSLSFLQNQMGDVLSWDLNTRSTIRSLTYQTQLLWTVNNHHEMRLGGGVMPAWHNPGTTQVRRQFSQDGPVLDTTYSPQSAIQPWQSFGYAEHQWQPGQALSTTVGLRYSHYRFDGAAYQTWEPRVSARWLLLPTTSLKANFTRMAQYTHVLVDLSTGIEREIWVFSDATIAPQRANQFSLGVFHSLPFGLELGVEGYYKRMENLLFLPPIEDPEGVSQWDERTVGGGEGEAYGLEVFGEYQQATFSGTLGYTLAWSNRRFSEINGGAWFPHQFNRRHSLNLTGQWQMNPRNSLSTQFVFQTGRPTTLPVGYIPGDEWLPGIYVTEGINNFRLPPYHRLDLTFRREMADLKRFASGYWAISVYNVYARQNAGALFWQNGTLMQRSDILFIPSFTLGWQF